MRTIQNLLESARDLGADSPAEEVAAVALQLAALQSEVGEHLEPLKEHLRSSGRAFAEGGRARILTDEGEVQVTYPSPTMRPRKGLSESDLREALGDRVFDECFEVVTTVRPRKGLEERLRARTASGAGATPTGGAGGLLGVLEWLDMKEATPRVGFRPNPDLLDL